MHINSEYLIQLVTNVTGAMGFCLVFRLRKSLILPASAGSALCWIIYIATRDYFNGIFLSSMITTAVVALYAKMLARKLKAPAPVFLIPGVLPIVPGKYLYYTMFSIVNREWQMAGNYCTTTVTYILGIAIGMSIIWSAYAMKPQLAQTQSK